MSYNSIRGVLLPVETSARELDAKLLLALFAAEAGFTCHLGAMSRIQRPGFPPSIYVSKSVRFAKAVRQMAAFGHTIVAWDEEGLVRFKDDIHSSRIEPEAFRLPSLLLSWGPSNSRIWREHPFYKGVPIIESGNPRIDLLRPELRPLHEPTVERLRRQHGRFVLFNTNFGFVNHFKTGGRPPKISRNSFDGAAYLAFRSQVDDHKRKLFQAFQAALPRLAEFLSPNKIIVRPHPSEDKESWRRASERLSNVEVIYEGPVVQWLLASSCLVHNSCTSAVEASVLGLPALAYRPIANSDCDFDLPNGLSENFDDIGALATRARNLLETGQPHDRQLHHSDLLRDNISALEGPFACERIVAAISRLQPPLEKKWNAGLSYYAASCQSTWKSLKRLIRPQDARYENHKGSASDFNAEVLAARAKAMGATLDRFHNIRFEQFADGIVTVSANPPLTAIQPAA